MQKVRTTPGSKVIIVGDPSVGKTSIISQFNFRVFDVTVESTVGAAYISKSVSTDNGPVVLHVWDTAGQERYRSLIPMYARNAVAAILVVDVTSQSSYESVDHWFTTLKENCSPNCRIYLVANKMDLEPQIPVGDLGTWGEIRELPFFKCTAMEYDSVAPIFNRIAQDLSSINMSNCVSQQSSLRPIETKGGSHAQCC